MARKKTSHYYCMKMYKIFLVPLLLLFPLAAFLSCRGGRECVPTESIRTQYVRGTLRDSIFVHDSVLVREKADTVFLVRTRTLYRDRLCTDTLWLRDTTITFRTVAASDDDNKAPGWSAVALFALFLLLLWRSGVLSLVRRLIGLFTK